MECEEILVDFWEEEYDTVLIGGKDHLYEMGKGLVKKYRLDRAVSCNLSESKTIVKNKSSQGRPSSNIEKVDSSNAEKVEP